MIEIKINQNTIKRNPDAGRTTFLVPGRWQQDADGSRHRDIQVVHASCPEPGFLFEYEPTMVECSECHQKFLHTELRSDSFDDGSYSDTICPKCGAWNCCEIKYERLQ